jgi:hypothetical protein
MGSGGSAVDPEEAGTEYPRHGHGRHGNRLTGAGEAFVIPNLPYQAVEENIFLGCLVSRSRQAADMYL